MRELDRLKCIQPAVDGDLFIDAKPPSSREEAIAPKIALRNPAQP
jgi:hypothetical protein